MPRDVGAERAAQQQLLREAERSIDAGVLAAIGGWLDVMRDALLQELGTPRRLAAAGTGDRTVPGGVANVDGAVNAAIQRSWGEWQNQLENSVLPTVSIAFGDAFQQIRRGDPQGAFNLQQQYLAEVSDRLKIWPQGAFEDIRPELIEALSDAATIDEMTERVGRVLNIDAKSRDLRARINDVEKRLADPDLDPDERAELRQWRRDLWTEHDESLNEWQWKARRIARTESHGAVSAGQLAAAQIEEQETGVRMWKRWLSTDDTRTRASHRVADGQTVPLTEPFRVGGFLLQHPADSINVAPHEVINCFVADTRVHAPGVQASMRSRYTGRMITVRMASGGVLTGTPNHPVLTERGWVGLGELNEGDQMVYARVGDRVGARVDPEIERIPATIGEVHDAFTQAGDGSRMLPGPVDFHGDVSDGEVDVVRADRELRDRIDAAHRKHVGDDVLEGRDSVSHPLPCDRSAGEFVVGAVHSSYGVVGSTGEAGAFIDAGLTHAGVHGGGSVAGRDTIFEQYATDDVAADAEIGGETLLRHAAEVTVDQARSVEHVAALLGYARVAHDAMDVASGDAEVFGDVLRSLTGGVSLDRVVAVDVAKSWSGHVFTLQSESAMFLAEGYIARNCRCTMLIYDDDELQDEFDDQGGKGDIEPGAVRIGPDDPDAADEAIRAVAEDENRDLPALGKRGEDVGQEIPEPPEDVELTDVRETIPVPDVETATDERLADYLVRTDELQQDELRQQVADELTRRREAEATEVQFGEPEPAPNVLEVDDDGAWLDDPRWSDDDAEVDDILSQIDDEIDEPITEADVDDWDTWQTTDDDLPDDAVLADPPEVVEDVVDDTMSPLVVQAQADYDAALAEFSAAADSLDDDRINEALQRMDAAEAYLAEVTQAAEVSPSPKSDQSSGDGADVDVLDDDGDDAADQLDDEDDDAEWERRMAAEREREQESSWWGDDEDDVEQVELTPEQRRRVELMQQADELAEAEGITYEEALAQVQGLDLEQVHRREFVAQGKREGLVSTSFGDMLDELHRRFVFDWELMAEEVTNGQMIKAAYRNSATPDMLWRVNDVTARKYMSDEMAEWFDENGRITKADLERMIEAGEITFDADACLGLWRRWSGRRLGEDYLR